MTQEDFNKSIQDSCSYLQGSLYVMIQDNFKKFLKSNICTPISVPVGDVSSMISIKTTEISKETLEFLLDCRADYVPANDNPGLLFLYANLYQLLDEDYFANDKKPSEAVLQEIAKIIETMKSVNATFMFLNKKDTK